MPVRIALVTSLFLLLAADALAHQGSPAWSEQKASRVVLREAAVRLPPNMSARIEEGLWNQVQQYRQLEQVASDEGDQHAAARFHNFRYRLSTALKKVVEGLSIADSACTGTGAGAGANRFKHFRCAVTSEVLRIPSAELSYADDDALPVMVETSPRTFGPYRAQLFVHAAADSTVTYRQLGDSSPVTESKRHERPVAGD
jgi:hypothetical protein